MILNTESNRIDVLDGFRALAILAVLFFHFYSRWFPPYSENPLYPYSNRYDYFHFGNMGVHLFFVISGFVIYFTLQKTTSFTAFWKKRLIRLYPSLLISTILIYLLMNILDKNRIFPNATEFKNLLTSVFLLPPTLLKIFFNAHTDLNYINLSYWSLWPEIQFYLLCSVIFYFNKTLFLRNFIIVSIILIGINYLYLHVTGTNKLQLTVSASFLKYYKLLFVDIFNVTIYLPYFSSGVLFYSMFSYKQKNIQIPNGVKSFILFFLFVVLYYSYHYAQLIINCVIFLFFTCLIYRPKFLLSFQSTFFKRIGVCSYFLYLIHEPLGVVLINLYANYFGALNFIFPLFVMVLLISISVWYTKVVEKKISALLLKTE